MQEMLIQSYLQVAQEAVEADLERDLEVWYASRTDRPSWEILTVICVIIEAVACKSISVKCIWEIPVYSESIS